MLKNYIHLVLAKCWSLVCRIVPKRRSNVPNPQVSKPLEIICAAEHEDPRMGRSVLYRVPPNSHGVIGFHSLGHGPDFTEEEFHRFLESPAFRAAERKMAEELKKPVIEADFPEAYLPSVP